GPEYWLGVTAHDDVDPREVPQQRLTHVAIASGTAEHDLKPRRAGLEHFGESQGSDGLAERGRESRDHRRVRQNRVGGRFEKGRHRRAYGGSLRDEVVALARFAQEARVVAVKRRGTAKRRNGEDPVPPEMAVG